MRDGPVNASAEVAQEWVPGDTFPDMTFETRSANLRAVLDDEPPAVIEEIHPEDPMSKFSEYAAEQYFAIGQEALSRIRLALISAGLESPTRILDFASGAGRVMRYLKAAFPAASLTACDFHMWQAEFCARVFGATAVEGREDPAEIELSGPFDLVWCGSHFPHIDGHRWQGFLKLFEAVLTPGGVVVFTVLGRYIAGLMRSGRAQGNLTKEQVELVLRDYGATGFGFQPNRFDGECVAAPSWVCRQLEAVPQLELLLYLENGWEGQDVIACKKAP